MPSFDRLYEAAYLINLADRTDRLRAAAAALQGAAIRYERFPGCPDRDGQTGCYNSHRALLALAAMRGQTTLIMEDDLIITPRFRAAADAYAQAIGELPGWDLVFFYCSDANQVRGTTKLLARTPTYCTHFYLVNGPRAARVLALVDRCRGAIDQIYIRLALAGELFSLCTTEQLVLQDTSRSDVRPTPWPAGSYAGIFADRDAASGPAAE